MENIAFIVTGQLRTFFENDDFLKMINLSKTKYATVFVICVLNPVSENDNIELNNFLNINNISNIVIDYSSNDYQDLFNNKCQNIKMEEMIKVYFSNQKHAHRGIPDPKLYSSNCTFIQYYQLLLGINALKQYINETNIHFDTICKTRFDCKYPNDFYPHIPEYDNIMKTISFNEYNFNIIQKKMDNYKLRTFEDLILFNKKNRLILPYGHISSNHGGLSIGGMVCYNYESLENIKTNGNKNIMYSFNDYFYFAKSDVFLKLENLFEHSCFYHPNNPDLYNHYFCPESQFVIFCLNNNIDIIMYPECLYDSLINR